MPWLAIAMATSAYARVGWILLGIAEPARSRVRELTAITMTNDNDRHESARLDRLLGNAFILFSADECLMQGKTTRVQHEHLWSQIYDAMESDRWVQPRNISPHDE